MSILRYFLESKTEERMRSPRLVRYGRLASTMFGVRRARRPVVRQPSGDIRAPGHDISGNATPPR